MVGVQIRYCPICKKPVRGDDHPGAMVYHMDCLSAKVRKDLEQNRQSRRQRKG